ncbi:MAG: hypothetical protein WCH07_03570, partial [Deltaproteobacteria bacterium]
LNITTGENLTVREDPNFYTFIYYYEVIELLETNTYCKFYNMKTAIAKIKILRFFNPPITSHELKLLHSVRSEKFITRNFQSKEFRIVNSNTINSLLSIR